MNIYRIIQESVNNSLKYANASKIEVAVSQNATHFIFSINDNGVGYDHQSVVMGSGLQNMKKRAQELNGDIKYVSGQVKGTAVRLQVPRG